MMLYIILDVVKIYNFKIIFPEKKTMSKILYQFLKEIF